jgi:hypothetical protein
MTDRQMKNGAAEFDAVTQQTCSGRQAISFEMRRAWSLVSLVATSG